MGGCGRSAEHRSGSRREGGAELRGPLDETGSHSCSFSEGDANATACWFALLLMRDKLFQSFIETRCSFAES